MALASPGLQAQEPRPDVHPLATAAAPVPEALKAFLAAREKDITAGRREPHRTFLLEMSRQGLGGRIPGPSRCGP